MLIDLPHLLGQVISNTFAGFSTNSLIRRLLSINILLSPINSLNVVTPIAVLISLFACFEVDGRDGVPESVVNGSSSWADTSGLEITCSWVEFILEVEVIAPADVRVQGCVLDDDVAVLVTVDLLQIDSSCGGWVGVCGCCCGWFPLPSNYIFLIIFKL